MQSVFVVLFPPSADQFTDLGETAEQIQVEHFIPYASIAAFDERIPVRLSGFDVIDHDAVGLTPVDEYLAAGADRAAQSPS